MSCSGKRGVVVVVVTLLALMTFSLLPSVAIADGVTPPNPPTPSDSGLTSASELEQAGGGTYDLFDLVLDVLITL